jgi:hypothetical protein
MPTVLRLLGFEFVVFPNDHLPAHVHAYHGDDVVVIDVSGAEPTVRRILGMKPRDVQRAVELATAHMGVLRQGWSRLHGPRLR